VDLLAKYCILFDTSLLREVVRCLLGAWTKGVHATPVKYYLCQGHNLSATIF
jgi:hypothetical protein